MFPIMLSLPTGSLKDFSRYLIRCLSKGYTSNSVITRFSIVKTTNKGGMAYAKAVFRMERKLSEDEVNLISKMSEEIKAISRKIGFEDINTTNTESPEIPEITEQNSIITVGKTA